jgi:predicted nuclease of predicted toxin-antitoxin system
MKILLDECVTKRLKPHLSEYEVYTVSEMKWNGIKNGKLMALCVGNNFDLLLTIDKNLMYQQNLDKFNLTVAVLNSSTSKIEELILFMPFFKAKASQLEKHKAYLIEK